MAALAIAIARQAGWTAEEPLAALLVAVLGASAVSEFVAIRLPRGGSTAQLHIRIAAQMLAITVPIYLTGWGPVLGCGYLYIFVDNFRKDGSRAETPLLIWLGISMAAGQVAIATGLVQSLVDPTAVHRVAALVFLG